MSEFNFDQAMKRLEKISEELAKDEIEMEEALKLFEEGLDLSARCQKRLIDYENKVNDLVLKHQGDAREDNN